ARGGQTNPPTGPGPPRPHQTAAPQRGKPTTQGKGFKNFRQKKTPPPTPPAPPPTPGAKPEKPPANPPYNRAGEGSANKMNSGPSPHPLKQWLRPLTAGQTQLPGSAAGRHHTPADGATPGKWP